MPIALARARARGCRLNDDDTTFYLADLTLLANRRDRDVAVARHGLHLSVAQRAPGDEFFNIPVGPRGGNRYPAGNLAPERG